METDKRTGNHGGPKPREVKGIGKLKNQLYLPFSFQMYHPFLVPMLQALTEPYRLERSGFPSGAPLTLTDDQVHNVVAPLVLNGDNYGETITDLYEMGSIKQLREQPILMNIFFQMFGVFVEERQDKATRVPVPTELRRNKDKVEYAIVASQSSETKKLAAMMAHTTGVDRLVTIDGHSRLAAEHFEDEGIDLINITAAKLMIDELRHKGLLDDQLETTIVGVDFGNLSLAVKLAQEEGFGLAVMQKIRMLLNGGPQSYTEHKLVYGDVKGKRVILMDDMIGSGGTLLHTVEVLLKAGAKEIIVCATHAVFAGQDYYKNLRDLLLIENVKVVMTTNTLPLRRPVPNAARSLPWAQLPKTDSREAELRKVKMLNIDNFIAWVTALMLRYPKREDLITNLGPYYAPQADPLVLYEQITGEHIEPIIPTAVYRPGGVYEWPDDPRRTKLAKLAQRQNTR